MRPENKSATARRIARLALAALILLPGVLYAQTTTYRTLTGTVTDPQKEPLAGAVVQVHDDATNSVVSFITTRTGRYTFKRLNGNESYTVTANYKGHKSKAHNLSIFDSKPNRNITLIVKLE
jgi:hypothetical protein